MIKGIIMLEHNVICIDKALNFHTTNLVLSSLLTMLPVNFLWCNEEGNIIGCNESAMSFFNFHEGNNDLIGKNLKNFGSVSAWSNTQKVLETGESLLIEENHIGSNGEKVYFLSMKSPIIKDNKIVGAVIIGIDITDRKRLEKDLIKSREELMIANESKKIFLDNIRHDLRFPFTGILGLSQMLAANEVNFAKKESLNDIVQSSELLLSHLNDIMSYVELENGLIPTIKNDFDITRVLQEVFIIMVPAAKTRGLDLAIKIEKDFTSHVLGDDVKLHRILLNLLSNAIKFTETGCIEIIGEWHQESNSTGIAKITIRDTGIGISPHKKDFIFGKFNRLDSSYHGKYDGKGLGLAIVKEFLDEIGGQIELKSVVGEGSDFIVAVPYEISLFHRIEKTLRNIKKVMLVEDYPIVSKISKKLLEGDKNIKCEVYVATTGEEAINLAKKNEYDLILMDIGLPDMSGYEATRQIISSKNSLNATTPIVALTAHEEIATECINAGMIDLIVKPLDEDKLQLVFAHFLPKGE